MICSSCKRETNEVYISLGYLGEYHECFYCFNGLPRPVEIELITDSFTPRGTGDAGLDKILDKLIGV